jgi:hypothetical protein
MTNVVSSTIATLPSGQTVDFQVLNNNGFLTTATVPVYDQTDFAGRLLRLLPSGWFPAVAPRLLAVLQAPAMMFSLIYGLLVFAKAQQRVASASGAFLDLAAQDYFGSTSPRLEYELDPAYAARIRYNMTAPRGTLSGMTSMLEQLTGNSPAIFQPNNVVQTGGWATESNPGAGGGVFAFYDETGESGAGLWGSMALPCQIFVTIEAPLTGYYSFAELGGVSTQNLPATGGGYGFASQSMPAAGGGRLAFIDPDSVPGAITNSIIYQQIAEWMAVGYVAWTQII